MIRQILHRLFPADTRVSVLLGPCGAALTGTLEDVSLTHADGVGGVQLAAVGALAVEGPDHVATHSIDARAGLAFVDI